MKFRPGLLSNYSEDDPRFALSYAGGGVSGATPQGADALGRVAYGFTGAGGVQDAAGLLGGPSLPENVKSGNYLDAALQGVSAAPVVGGLAKGLLGAGALFKAAKMSGPEIKAALDPSVVRMFLGPNAKTADKAALAEAEALHSSGASREDIWNKTGWFKGVDDKWRFEVPDNEASLKGYIQPGAAFEGELPDAINHPHVYDAYPNMRDININYGQSGVSSGAYAPPIDGIHGMDEHIRIGQKSSDPLSTGIHEMQHAIQDREGFAAGGNNFTLKPGTPAWDIYQERLQAIKTPLNRETYSLAAGYDGLAPEKDYKAYLKIVKNPAPFIIKEAQKYAADTAYLRQAGEVEARTTQKRMDMTADERKARYPWLDYDVPENQQLVRFRGLLGQ